jgi:hypothetical protein
MYCPRPEKKRWSPEEQLLQLDAGCRDLYAYLQQQLEMLIPFHHINTGWKPRSSGRGGKP